MFLSLIRDRVLFEYSLIYPISKELKYERITNKQWSCKDGMKKRIYYRNEEKIGKKTDLEVNRTTCYKIRIELYKYIWMVVIIKS